MRKLGGPVLMFVGGFLVLTGLLSFFYVSDAVRVTPLDIRSINLLEGEATVGSEPAVAVRVTSTTLADSEKSDGDVVSFLNSTCVVKLVGDTPNCVSADDPENRLLLVTEDAFATDRKTALAVNDPKYVPAGAHEHSGLVNKWPTDAQPHSYPYWDNTIRRAVDAEYVGKEKVQGVDTLMYRVNIVDAPAEVTAGVQGVYSSEKTIWVEPVTGRIVSQAEHQTRVTDSGDNVLNLDVTMTPETSKRLTQEAVDKKRELDLVDIWVPVVGLLLGVPALVGGVILTLRGRRSA